MKKTVFDNLLKRIPILVYSCISFTVVKKKILLSMKETQGIRLPSLIGEIALEEKMATYSSILVWDSPWTEEPGGLQSMWSQRITRDNATHVRLNFSHQTLTCPSLQAQSSSGELQ